MEQTQSELSTQAIVELMKNFSIDLGKEVVRDLIDGTEREWSVTFKSMTTRATKTVRGIHKSRDPVATIRENVKLSRSNVYGILSQLEYGEFGPLLGSTLNTAADTYSFASSWYSTLKLAKAIATATAGGPIGLTLAIVDVFTTVNDAWNEASQWYDSLGLEEHQLQGKHLQRLQAYYNAIVKNSAKAVQDSFSLPDASQLRQQTKTLREKLDRIMLIRQNEKAVYSHRNQVISNHKAYLEKILLSYETHLRALIGIGLQGTILSLTLDKVREDVDDNPLRYWGCSFQSGYQNPGTGLLGELTPSFVLIKPHVKEYMVSATFSTPQMREKINQQLTAIKTNVRGAAIGLSNQLSTRTLPLLSARTRQLVEEIKAMRMI